MICGCYRRDEAQDPETFAAALAAVLSDYPTSVTEYAADPRTGVVTKFPTGLPNIGQIKQFLDDIQTRQDRISRYSALPKPKPVVRDKPPKAEPNLFVPDSSNRYGAMLKMHEQHKGERSYLGSKVCTDGVNRSGIFVPLDWWEAPQGNGLQSMAGAARKVFEKTCAEAGIDPARGVSPALLKTLSE